MSWTTGGGIVATTARTQRRAMRGLYVAPAVGGLERRSLISNSSGCRHGGVTGAILGARD